MPAHDARQSSPRSRHIPSANQMPFFADGTPSSSCYPEYRPFGRAVLRLLTYQTTPKRNSPNEPKRGEASDKREARNTKGGGGLHKRAQEARNQCNPARPKQTKKPNQPKAEERPSRKGNREHRLKRAKQRRPPTSSASGWSRWHSGTHSHRGDWHEPKLKQPGREAQPPGQEHRVIRTRQARKRDASKGAAEKDNGE